MKIAFVLNVYRDQALAVRLANQVLELFGQKAIVIGDGVPIDPGLAKVSHSWAAPRLKHQFSLAWTKRYLQVGFESGADHVIKLDPDSFIHRRFTPPDADWYGTLGLSNDYVRGGACGFRRNIIPKVLNYTNLDGFAPYSYRRWSKHRWPHEEYSDEVISNQDHNLKLAMLDLGIVPTTWPDVLIYGNENVVPSGDLSRFAITHPHPTL